MKHGRGFTLVEVLVALAVTTLLVIVFTDYLMNNTIQSVRAADRASILAQTEQSLNQVTKAIRISANADSTNRWPDPNGPGGNQYGWQSNSSTLILATAATDTSGNIIFSDPEDYITVKNNLIFFVSNGTLYERILAAPVSNNSVQTTCPASDANSSCPPDKPLLNNVSSFTINYYNGQNQAVTPSSARAIQLKVVVSANAYGKTVSVNYTTWMVFPND